MEIKFRNVSLSFKEKLVFQDVSFVCKKGEITTFLHDDSFPLEVVFALLCGKINPNEGHVVIGDKEVSSRKNKKIGYFSQFAFTSLFRKTVRDELSFSLKKAKKKEVDDQEKISVLERVFLSSSYLDRKIVTLSRGERQRVALASFLLFDYDILLLEEPFFGFFDEEKKEFVSLLKSLKKGKTILLSTSSSVFAQEVSDFIYLMAGEQVLASGNYETLLSSRSFLTQAKVAMPPILDFIDTVYQEKNVSMMYRKEMNDLIKDIYRVVK